MKGKNTQFLGSLPDNKSELLVESGTDFGTDSLNSDASRVNTSSDENDSDIKQTLINEMIRNFTSNNFVVVHSERESLKKSKENVAESDIFDGNDSLNFDKARFEKFIDYYKLEELFTRRDGIFSKIYYVAPNKTVIYTSNFDSGSVSLINKSHINSLTEVVEEFNKIENRPNYQCLLSTLGIAGELFPVRDKEWNYEEALNKIYMLEDTVITDELKEYIIAGFTSAQERCERLTKPTVGSLVRRINVVGDGSYSDNFLKVTDVRETYVILQAIDGVCDLSFNTSLEVFWDNFKQVELDEIVRFMENVLWQLMDDELFNAICTKEFIDRKPKSVYVGTDVSSNDFIINNAIFSLAIYSIVGHTTAKLSLVRPDSTLSRKLAVGSILDLPLVLNYINGEKTKLQVSDVLDQFVSFTETVRSICDAFYEITEGAPEIREIIEKVNTRIGIIKNLYFNTDGNSPKEESDPINSMSLF